MGAVGCCGDRHNNQEYHGMAPAIEPMRQLSGNNSQVSDLTGAHELPMLGSAEAPAAESLPSIDVLRLSWSPDQTSAAPRISTPAPRTINVVRYTISPRATPSPRFRAASSQLGTSPLRSLSSPPPSLSHGNGLFGTGSPRGLVNDLRLWRMASSPVLREIALSPRSVMTEACGDDDAAVTNTEASHEALSAPWPWPTTVARGPGLALGTKGSAPVIAG